MPPHYVWLQGTSQKCTDVSVKGSVRDRGTLTKLISRWKHDKSESAALHASVTFTLFIAQTSFQWKRTVTVALSGMSLDYKCEEHWILTVSLIVCTSNTTRTTVEGVHFHVFTDSLIHLVLLITSLTFEFNLTHAIIRHFSQKAPKNCADFFFFLLCSVVIKNENLQNLTECFLT